MEKFSYSKISTFSDCHFKFYLKYKLGNFVDSSGVATEFGCLIHKISELQTLSLIKGEPIDYEMLKDYFVNVNIPKKSKYDRDGDIFGVSILAEKYGEEWLKPDKTGRSYEDKAQEFLAKGIYRQEQYLAEHPELELVGAEVPFEFIYRDYVFRGFIDRLLRYKDDPDHYVVHDLKTASQPYDDKKLASPLQLFIYAEALRQQYGQQTKVDCFYEFPIANAIRQGGTKGWEKRCLNALNKNLDLIEAGEWKPNPSPLCHWCEYSDSNPNRPEAGRHLCPYYSLWTPTAKSYATKLPWLGIENHDIQVAKLKKLCEIDSEDFSDFDI